MKKLLFTACILIAAAHPANAQVAKADFDKRTAVFKMALDARNKNTDVAAGERGALVTMMNTQISYMTAQENDKSLNNQCNLAKQSKSKDMSACNKLSAIASTLKTEKNSLNFVTGVADKDLYNKEAQLLAQLQIFSGTLQ